MAHDKLERPAGMNPAQMASQVEGSTPQTLFRPSIIEAETAESNDRSAPGLDRWLFNAVARLGQDATILVIGQPCIRLVTSMVRACRGTGRLIQMAEMNASGRLRPLPEDSEIANSIEVSELHTNFLTDCSAALSAFRSGSRKADLIVVDGQRNSPCDFDRFLAALKPGGTLAVTDLQLGHSKTAQEWSRQLQKDLVATGHFFSLAYGRKPPAGGFEPRVHLIIPVFNRKALTHSCLRQAFSQTVIDRMTVNVVDDGSTDGTDEMLASEFPKAKVIKGDGTLWWTGAIAKALDELRPSFAEGDFFLLVNNDTFLSNETVEVLVRESQLAGRAGTAPIAVNGHTGEAISTGWGPGSQAVLNNLDNLLEAMAKCDGRFEVQTLFGRCSLFPVEILDRVENYDAEAFPHYFGDTDFCLRAHHKGFRFFVASSTCVRVVEEEAATGSHFKFRQGPQSFTDVWANMTSLKSIENVPATWRYMLRHYRSRAGINTASVIWLSLRHWAPIYKALGLKPLIRNSKPAKSKSKNATGAPPRGTLTQVLGRRLKPAALEVLEFVSFWTIRSTFFVHKQTRRMGK